MKFQKTIIFVSLAVICLLMLTGCVSDSAFCGNIISTDDEFQMNYSILSQCQKASVQLESGDVLDVVISNESGNVDVSVGMDDAEPVYIGKGLADFSFSLNISESGIYSIAVTGHNASGSVSFTQAAE